MIVTKNLRADVLGEPLFEKVNLVIRSGERIALVGANDADVTLFMRTLAGDSEMDEGTITAEGERIVYISPEIVNAGFDALAQTLHSRTTFLVLNCGTAILEPSVIESVTRFIRGFQGGILLAAADSVLMQTAKITRVFELQTPLKTITSYTGSYDTYLIEKEKNDARANETYKRQQREKQRLEEWLEVKRKEASLDRRSPEKGATIRAKVKYLKREILDKEIPKPASLSDVKEE